MPESVKRRGSSGPTIGAMLGLCSGVVAMPARIRRVRGVEVTVRLFAMLRERAEGLPLVMAVNREYASAEHRLDAGDELALIPPVSGGAAPRPWARVRSEPLELDPLAARVRDPRAGAVVTFSGVTRDVDVL